MSDTQLFTELDRSVTELGLTTIVYLSYDGDLEDPATRAVKRVAVFPPDFEPYDLQAMADEQESKSYYRRWFNGFKSAIIDDEWEVAKESDDEAKRFREEQQTWRKSGTSMGMDGESEAGPYEQFLVAIDTFQQDPNNEEAWAVIEAYRKERLRQSDARERE